MCRVSAQTFIFSLEPSLLRLVRHWQEAAEVLLLWRLAASSAGRRRRRLLCIVRYSKIIAPCFIILLSPRTVHRSRRAPTVPSLHEPVTSSRPMHRPTRPPRASRLRWPTRDPRSPSRHPPHTAASSRRGPPRGGYSGPGTHTYYLRLASLT
jgi:hypothetical protein